jgi:hypothetical protein
VLFDLGDQRVAGVYGAAGSANGGFYYRSGHDT